MAKLKQAQANENTMLVWKQDADEWNQKMPQWFSLGLSQLAGLWVHYSSNRTAL